MVFFGGMVWVLRKVGMILIVCCCFRVWVMCSCLFLLVRVRL